MLKPAGAVGVVEGRGLFFEGLSVVPGHLWSQLCGKTQVLVLG